MSFPVAEVLDAGATRVLALDKDGRIVGLDYGIVKGLQNVGCADVT